MISIRNTVGLFLLFVSFIISLNSAAAVPVTIDYTLTKPSTADILPGYQTFDSGDDCLIWTHPLYFGAIIFDLCVLDLSALQSNGSVGLGYELTTLMNNEAD